ncbi:MAG: hypothetical protein OEX08_00895 [Candidatus Nomurabacteria bacterium]|nr:hypothetical protein [Candidatus Nomurabacteria bacterium]
MEATGEDYKIAKAKLLSRLQQLVAKISNKLDLIRNADDDAESIKTSIEVSGYDIEKWQEYLIGRIKNLDDLDYQNYHNITKKIFELISWFSSESVRGKFDYVKHLGEVDRLEGLLSRLDRKIKKEI